MAQVILHSQIFRFNDIMDQFPAHKVTRKKMYFQAELNAIGDNEVSFHIIAYPAWRLKGKWYVGQKICSAETGNGSVIPFKEPLGFANNEIILSGFNKKKAGKKAKKTHRAFAAFASKIARDQKLASIAIFRCHTWISENPHLGYDITLESEGTSLTLKSNPSPPAPPEY
jgi:hypothetical protein